MWCVERMMVRPFLCLISKDQMARRAWASIPAVGSSKITKRLPPIRAIAILSFRFMPPRKLLWVFKKLIVFSPIEWPQNGQLKTRAIGRSIGENTVFPYPTARGTGLDVCLSNRYLPKTDQPLLLGNFLERLLDTHRIEAALRLSKIFSI